jgi:hypothetical protein
MLSTKKQSQNKLLEKKVVAKLSSGNINLQNGIYQTADDITAKLDKLKNYNFCK